MVKGGRCWNGAHRDAGKVVHAVHEVDYAGDNFEKALCGTAPGPRSYGWTYAPNELDVNCPKCVKKMEALRASYLQEGGGMREKNNGVLQSV